MLITMSSSMIVGHFDGYFASLFTCSPSCSFFSSHRLIIVTSALLRSRCVIIALPLSIRIELPRFRERYRATINYPSANAKGAKRERERERERGEEGGRLRVMVHACMPNGSNERQDNNGARMRTHRLRIPSVSALAAHASLAAGREMKDTISVSAAQRGTQRAAASFPL